MPGQKKAPRQVPHDRRVSLRSHTASAAAGSELQGSGSKRGRSRVLSSSSSNSSPELVVHPGRLRNRIRRESRSSSGDRHTMRSKRRRRVHRSGKHNTPPRDIPELHTRHRSVSRHASRHASRGRRRHHHSSSDSASPPSRRQARSSRGKNRYLRYPTYETDSDDQSWSDLDEVRRDSLRNFSGGLTEFSDNDIIDSFSEPISTPIESQIPKKLRLKIIDHKYFDLAQLLPSDGATDETEDASYCVEVSNSKLNVVRDKVSRKIKSISQWTSAFIRFVAIYAKEYPNQTPRLMKYMEIVRDLANKRNGDGWMVYDIKFRKLMETKDMSWASLVTEYWLSAATPRPTSNANTALFRKQANPNPNVKYDHPCCFDYNRSSCPNKNCKYPHVCGFCKGKHSAKLCKHKGSKLGYGRKQTPKTN